MLSSKLLSEFHCCVRCCLRLSGQMLGSVFSSECRKEDMVAALEPHVDGDILQSKQAELNSQEPQICSLCLGLLSNHSLTECIDKITQQVKQQDYDSGTFSINAIIPNAINIRQHSFSLFASERSSTEEGQKLQLRNIVSVKDAFKFGLVSKIEELTGKKCDSKSFLRVTISMNYKDEEKEISMLPIENQRSYSRKRKHNGDSSTPGFPAIQQALDKLKDVESMAKYYPCPPTSPTECCFTQDVGCFQESIFIGGRYNKYSRELSQSPWVIEGVRKTESSVQELACQQVQDFFRADDIKFISAGREDVDVKMLGSGRPFAIELLNPRKTKASPDQLKVIETSTNNATELIAVTRLTLLSKSDMTLLKEGEEHKIKFYKAIVYAKEELSDVQLESLSNFKDLVLAQKTPLRVLHRRPLAVRNKTIHAMSAERIDERHFTLSLSTQAGTYIKEFVHSDFRRTKPSLGSLLGAETDILELDVEEVQLDWPPASDPKPSDNNQEISN